MGILIENSITVIYIKKIFNSDSINCGVGVRLI